MIERGIRILVWSIGIIVALNNAGFDVGALIAGLGIGGLAVALAAQDTVKNIFGGIMIFIDKPFRIGDRILIENYDGFVEYIGVRSTRMRTLSGRLVTIPNAHFTDRPIENITIEPARRIDLVVGLTYNTPPEKIDLAISIMKEISKGNPNIINEQTFVFFETFNASSLDIKFVYYIHKSSDIFEAQTSVNREILKRFNENGLEFAFPTRTVYNLQE
jgi:MscS family membrane protein